MQERLPKRSELQGAPCLATIDLLQRALDVTTLALENEFQDPWHRTLGLDEKPGAIVCKALLAIHCLELQLYLLRQDIEETIEEMDGPIPF